MASYPLCTKNQPWLPAPQWVNPQRSHGWPWLSFCSWSAWFLAVQHQPTGSFTSKLITTGKRKDWPSRELTTKSRLIPGDAEVISTINRYSNSVFMKVKETYWRLGLSPVASTGLGTLQTVIYRLDPNCKTPHFTPRHHHHQPLNCRLYLSN